MAEVLCRRDRHGEVRSGLDAEDAGEGGRTECGSASTEEAYSSDGEGAPDLEVEASPFQDGSNNGRMVREDADASFFSDYEAETRSKACAETRSSTLPPPLQRSPLMKRPHLAHPLSRDATRQVEGLNAGDAFYDAEYASSMGRQRGVSPPSSVSETVANSKHGKALSTGSVHSGGYANSWLDPLRPLSSPPVDVEGDYAQSGRSLRAPHGLSDSPRRGSGSSHSAPQSDSPLSYGGSPFVAVREGTAAGSQASFRVVATDLPERRSFLQGSRDYVGASERAADVRPLSTTTQGRCDALANEGSRALAPRPPQGHPSKPRAPSTTGRQTAIVASPSSHKSPTTGTTRDDIPTSSEMIVRAQVPGLHPLSTSILTDTSSTQTRVVRERAPRGVPLLLQCTEHAHTPTRTILVPSAAEKDDADGDDDETVNAGLHTSAYCEASGVSDLISSASHESSVTPAEKNSHVNLMHHTSEGAANCRHRTARSRSPFVSLVENHPSGAGAALMYRQQAQPLSSRGASPSSSISAETVAAAPPRLVDFSVHTEALESSAQEDSLVLCGFSVESLPMLMEATRVGEESHRSSHHSPVAQPPHPPRLPEVPRRTHSTVRAPGADASPHRQPSREEYTSSAASHSRNQPRPAQVHVATSDDDSKFLWPSRELVYPAQETELTTGAAMMDSPKESLKVFDLHYVVDSVEEAVVGGSAGHSYISPCVGPYGAYDRGHDAVHSNSAFAQARCTVEDTVSGTSASEYSLGQLQHRQQQREAVRQLLARQTDLRHHSRSRPHYYGDVDVERDMVPQPLSSAAYVMQQERLREQRMAAEAERLRLELALDVCQAVRPYGRDLLLMFLLLVEESNAALRLRRRNSKALEGRYDTFADPAQWRESRVSYEMCAEAVNCVLERHGVGWIRATRELCRRVVAWCRRHQQGSAASRDLSSISMDDTLVEYATFVSCVMEFVVQYPSSSS
ncbi:hypothetical protein ABL78_3279 [Leptomonas seymouri]|uniref:Uncharacterized protein n=1 Tax=Leptomonas seymouri TaxID=5684 RepID=A0A0N1PES5_LEPSE|nr:hypothetical protein ABL78_3279 [Leptomonas seymouri]|eukprot:KPI87622.1 hypothetical protein ABL78_3279 [Leptomonas seymouri]